MIDKLTKEIISFGFYQYFIYEPTNEKTSFSASCASIGKVRCPGCSDRMASAMVSKYLGGSDHSLFPEI